MSNGTVCTPEEFALSISSQEVAFVCLTRTQSIGLALDTEAGFISFVAVMVAFGLIFRKVFRHVKLIEGPADIYMLSLFLFDLIMAIGWMSDVKWVVEGKLYTGKYCTAQGIVKQLGITGVALSTLAITIHTFMVVIWGKNHRLTIAYFVVASIWVFLIIFLSLSVGLNTHGSNFYETPVGFWCWIGDRSRYNMERFAGQYVWMWANLCVSAFTYIALFFWARGNFNVSPSRWWKFKFHRKSDLQHIDPEGRRRRSIGMIVFPLSYCVTIIPFSCVRWRSGFGTNNSHHLHDAATFATQFIFGLSGIVNVTLFYCTRSELLSLRDAPGRSYRFGIAPAVGLNDATEFSEAQQCGVCNSMVSLNRPESTRSLADTT